MRNPRSTRLNHLAGGRQPLPVTRAQFHEAPVKRLWLRHFDEAPTTPRRDAQVSRRQTDQEFTI
jgi:hypothetical protein